MAITDHLIYEKCENSRHSREEEADRLSSSFSPFFLAKATSWFHSQGLHQVIVLMEQGRPKPAPKESYSPNSFQ